MSALRAYHSQTFMPIVALLVEQQLRGIYVDQDLLRNCRAALEERIVSSMQAFLDHPLVAPHIAEYNTEVHSAWQRAQPPRLTKAGEESKRWQAWRDREQRWMADNGFNPNSKQQLAWVFFDRLGFTPPALTETGRPAVNRQVLPALGEPGKLLSKYNLYIKRRGYVDAVIAKSARDGLLHPQFNSVGTVTGRLGGSGGLNCFPSSVDILTGRGWVPATEVLDSDSVWEVDAESLAGNWTSPLAVIKQWYSGTMISFGGQRGELTVTADHRMAWYGAKNQRHKYLGTQAARDLFSQARACVASASNSCTISAHSPEEIWTALMTQADGARRKGKAGVWQFGFKKKRKISKATELLGPGRPWRDQVRWNHVRFSSELLDSSTKTLRLAALGTCHAEIVLEAVTFWDGYRIATKDGTRIEYTSVDKINVDELSAYFSRAGYSTTVRQYSGYWRLIINSRVFQDIRKDRHVRRELVEDILVGCVTVPSGHIMVRSGGRTWITGNCQQMPKVAEFLQCLRARPGFKLVQADAEALEPTVLAEFSQDKTLMTLYGPNAKPNDIYLFVAAKIPALGAEIRKYYDPDNPTPEGIALAKKHCKQARQIAKVVVLAANYNAGPGKIQETLRFGGIDLPFHQVKEIHRSYWRLFYGVKRFEEKLKDMWIERKGWIPSVLGTPICVDSEYVKDIVNRFCQTSGHQILQVWIAHIDRLRKERGVEMYPWLVDNHDETIFEAPEAQAEAAAQILRDALAATNAELGMGIPIKAEPMIVDNLAQIKDAEGWAEIQKVKAA